MDATWRGDKLYPPTLGDQQKNKSYEINQNYIPVSQKQDRCDLNTQEITYWLIKWEIDS